MKTSWNLLLFWLCLMDLSPSQAIQSFQSMERWKTMSEFHETSLGNNFTSNIPSRNKKIDGSALEGTRKNHLRIISSAFSFAATQARKGLWKCHFTSNIPSWNKKKSDDSALEGIRKNNLRIISSASSFAATQARKELRQCLSNYIYGVCYVYRNLLSLMFWKRIVPIVPMILFGSQLYLFDWLRISQSSCSYLIKLVAPSCTMVPRLCVESCRFWEVLFFGSSSHCSNGNGKRQS
mmetsp:Transcript_30064/g.72152  ORF Transcript_30064/g.72152 Transcript_30064/m.72152 type:complete len:236 (-) Transcript_30064:680-1387(-)